MDNIADRVLKVIAKQFASLVTVDTTFDELEADSLDLLETVMALEDEFGIEIPDEAYIGWKTVQGVIDYVEGRFEI